MPSLHEEVELRLQELVANAAPGEWSVSPGTFSQVAIDIVVTYRVAFGSVFDEARPGPLPASAMKFDASAMRTMVEALRATKARTLKERLEPWLAEHGNSDSSLTAPTCLGSAPVFGYEFPCEGCAAALHQACECEGKGVRHVTGTVACHVGRTFALQLSGLPDNAPAWLRDATSAEPFKAITDLSLVELRCEPGFVKLVYKGELSIEQCELTVRDETSVVWAFGDRKRDFAQAVERLLAPTSDELRDALEDGRDIERAARAFFAAPLHETLATLDQPDDKHSADAKLVSAEYLARAHQRAQDAMIAMARAARRTRAKWILLLAPLAALSLHAASISRLLAGLAAAFLACALYVLMVLRDRSALRSAWGIALPAGSARAPALALGVSSVVAAFFVAGIPSALPLRVLHAAGARDRLTGIYENGDERLLVLPTARNAYVVRHVTPDCDEFVLVELHITGDFIRAHGDAPFVRSEGPSFVLLPNQAQGCGERDQPARFTRSRGAMSCTVASEHARPISLAKKPFKLAHGTPVEVLPWAPNMRQVLVRADDRIGTLAASDLSCPKRGLAALRDVLFTKVESAQR